MNVLETASDSRNAQEFLTKLNPVIEKMARRLWLGLSVDVKHVIEPDDLAQALRMRLEKWFTSDKKKFSWGIIKKAMLDLVRSDTKGAPFVPRRLMREHKQNGSATGENTLRIDTPFGVRMYELLGGAGSLQSDLEMRQLVEGILSPLTPQERIIAMGDLLELHWHDIVRELGWPWPPSAGRLTQARNGMREKVARTLGLPPGRIGHGQRERVGR